MFELTNAQRLCFALRPVEDHWTQRELKPSPYDRHRTFAWLDGDVIRKLIQVGPDHYLETELCDRVSEDGKYLLPRTAKGKPVLLSAATASKRKGLGMALYYQKDFLRLVNQVSCRDYYMSYYDPLQLGDIGGFARWVQSWCAETTPEDLQDLSRFAAEQRKHVRFREGDVFRFKINRRLYGYGRVLLDYDAMRKRKEPFWDVLMTKPVVVSLYHIATEDPNVPVSQLAELKSLPSHIIMDNGLYYGELEIIGHLPVGRREDHPILYGSSIRVGETAELLQCGRLYLRRDNERALFHQYRNNGVGGCLRLRLDLLRRCIEAGSNEPWWSDAPRGFVYGDLRNPASRGDLEQICARFGITPEDLIP